MILHRLVCHQVDVSNVYLAATLSDETYIRIPHGLELLQGIDLTGGDCLLVLKSLYGLKQAARL